MSNLSFKSVHQINKKYNINYDEIDMDDNIAEQLVNIYNGNFNDDDIDENDSKMLVMIAQYYNYVKK